MKYSSINEIIKDAKRGKMFILVDDEDRENEADLIIPASKVSPDSINFMARYGRGLICLTMCQKQADKLNLSLINSNTIAKSGTAFTISIDTPSGLPANPEFKNYNSIINSDITITFEIPKLSFLLPNTGNYVGDLKILSIGLNKEFIFTS